jgi:hypothetical protein
VALDEQDATASLRRVLDGRRDHLEFDFSVYWTQGAHPSLPSDAGRALAARRLKPAQTRAAHMQPILFSIEQYLEAHTR